jgi:hypothetical protein
MSDNRRIRFTIAIETEYDNNLINYNENGMDRIREVLNSKPFGYLLQTGEIIKNEIFMPINEDIREVKGTEEDSEARSISHA